MENQKNDNLNLLEAVVQNTEMGKNTLEQIVPMTEDPAFRAELLRERNLYRELNQEAHTAIEACGGTAQGPVSYTHLLQRRADPVPSILFSCVFPHYLVPDSLPSGTALPHGR